MANSKISALTSASTPLAGTEVLPIVQSGATVKVSAADITAGRAVSAASYTASSGDLAFSSTAQRITADLSNGTITNRLFFQTSTANSNSSVSVIPSGTAVNSTFATYNNSNPTNASIGTLGVVGSTEVRLSSSITGTGTYLPLAVYTNGAKQFVFDTSGNLVPNTAAKGVNFTANTALAGMTSQLLNWYEEGTTTPTVAATSGTITSYTVSAAYTRIGRSITFVANVTITNAGTGAGALTITLPWTANGSYAFNGAGRENALTGYLLQGYIAAGGTVVNVTRYDGTTAIATNAQIRVTITYFA